MNKYYREQIYVDRPTYKPKHQRSRNSHSSGTISTNTNSFQAVTILTYTSL